MDSIQNVKGGKRCGVVGDYFVDRTNASAQPSIRIPRTTMDLKERVDIVVDDFIM